VGNGEIVRFWEDTWLGESPLAIQYPSLYNIVQRKNVLVSSVLEQTPLNIAFRRTLNEYKYNLWLHLCQRLMSIQLSDELDKFLGV
jgi:hypothetical protein